MSKNIKNKIADHEVGSTKSYIIGFFLSLVFTLIPYYLVVNEKISGSTLLATILVFAVVQMFIQVFFFLHLGRGPKPLYNVVFFVFTAGTILFVVIGSVFIMSHLHYNMSPSEVTKNLAEGEGIYQVDGKRTGACQQLFANHKIIISEGALSPLHTSAHLCDTVTFVNNDDTAHTLTFGTGTNKGTYSGQSTVPVRKRVNKTITLNQTGTYRYQDALDDRISGDFTVTP
jgi:cytochrome o ubiquinol oxidase operon protein cyoD